MDEELRAITYKPGWSFTWVRQAQEPHLFLRIGVGQPDPKGTDPATGDERYVEFLFVAPEPFDPSWLHEHIMQIEAHEVAEWLRVNGEHIVAPHPPEVGEEPDDGMVDHVNSRGHTVHDMLDKARRLVDAAA